MEPGGHAHTVGGTYEDRWAGRQLLHLIAGEIRSLEREPAGPEGAGVDFWVEAPNGALEAHQCKSTRAFASGWSLADLSGEGVLDNLRFQLARDERHRYCFVSGLPAPELDALARSARDSRDAESFWQQQVRPIKRRREPFQAFCGYLLLSPTDPHDRELARDLLRRTHCHLFQDTREELRRLQAEAGRWVRGNPGQVLDALASFTRGHLRQRIHLDQLAPFLRDRGLPLRGLAHDPRLTPGIERLQNRFRDSFRSLLVGNLLLPRSETDQVLAALAAHRLVLLHGIAGTGKSGVLYDLAERLHAAGTLYLPLRLDRQALRESTERFGEDLALPGSPALCLQEQAGTRQSVLLLDQLDALRWTSVHSGEAWEVCRELIGEALQRPTVQVVVSCRTFDLEHDPQIRAWAQEAAGHAIVVGALSEPEVARLVEQLGGSYDNLSPRERSLLTNFFHLSLWGDILAQSGAAPRFSTSQNLLGAFWSSRYDALADRGVSQIRAAQILQRLVDAMEREETLVAPLHALHALDASERERQAFLSLNILQLDEGRLSFGHQGYLDYLIARRALDEIDRGAATVGSWLGDRARQSFFRRERLRLVLGLLREERPAAHMEAVRELLGARGVRFHVKQLVLQSLGQLDDPRPPEIALVLELLDDAGWRPHALAEIIGVSPRWFEAIDERGLPAAWLAQQDAAKRDAMVDVLKRFAHRYGDRVASLLAPYEQRDAEWDQRCAWIVIRGHPEDSGPLFAFYLRLAQRGVLSGQLIDWNRLARFSFTRFVELLETTISARHQRGMEERRPIDLLDAHWPMLNRLPLEGVSPEDLRRGLRAIGRSLDLVCSRRAQDLQESLTLDTSGLQSASRDSLFQVATSIAARLIHGPAPELAALLAGDALPLSAQVSLLHALAETPKSAAIADLALAWLLADPARLRLRVSRDANEWHLSAPAVVRLSSSCSADGFERFERCLLDFREPDLVERYRRRHEMLMTLFRRPTGDEGHPHDVDWLAQRPSFSGATPYHLLPHLDAARISPRVRRVRQELERKFADVPQRFFGGRSRTTGGLVRAPIPQAALERLSDHAWLRIMTSPRLHRPRRPFHRIGEGFLEESTVYTFSMALRGIAGQHPERFARFALRLPQTVDPQFLEAILDALGSVNQQRPAGQEGAVERERAAHETLEALLALPALRDDALALQFCRLVQAHADHPWTDGVLLHLVAIAKRHPDPAPGHYGVIMEQTDDDIEDEHLGINALNCTRGAAGYAIEGLLFAQPARLLLLAPALESMVRDPHPAVRVAAIAAALPVLGIDRAQAISWFLAACETDERVLPTNEVNRFLPYVIYRDFPRLAPLVERMVGSRSVKIARAGAFWTGAGHLQAGDDASPFAPHFARCLDGTPAHRQGIAEVAGILLREPARYARAKSVLGRLVDDPDAGVRQRVASAVVQSDFDLFPPGDPFLQAFAASRAFSSDPHSLYWKLKNHPGPMLDFASCVLQAGRTLAADHLAAGRDDPRARPMPDAGDLVPLLLRLYAETARSPEHQAIHLECLDLWDLLLERQVIVATELIEQLDRL